MKKYKRVALGGTFDHLHKGHKDFLLFAAAQAEKIAIGITTDQYVKAHKKSDSIQPFDIRKKSLVNFLNMHAVDFDILPLDTASGPLEESMEYQALAVSDNTYAQGLEINKKRICNNLSPLDLLRCPLTKAQDGDSISSTRIRNGEINREGRLYVRPEWLSHSLQLSESIRQQLKNPLGTLIKDPAEYIQKHKKEIKKCITVGDITTQLFNSFSIPIQIGIVDFTVARKKIFNDLADLGFTNTIRQVLLKNPSSTINQQAFGKLKKLIQYSETSVLVVDGEEDLLTMVAVLVAPLNYSIFYGQPHEGLVQIKIDEEVKEEAYSICSQLPFTG